MASHATKNAFLDDDEYHLQTGTNSFSGKAGHGLDARIKRDDLVQTALDIIVESGGTTVGDVLIGSIPSEPTTVSLPGYGALTISSIVPATPTMPAFVSHYAVSSAATPAMSKPAAASSSSGSETTATAFNSSSISTAFSSSLLSSGMANSTIFSNFTTSTFNTSSTFLSSSTTTHLSSSTTSLVTSTSFASSSITPGPVGVIPAATGTPSSTAAASSTPPSNQSTGKIVGATVGGVAGAILLVAIIFVVLRRLRNNENGTRLDDGEEGGDTAPVSRDGPPGGGMTQRSSLVPFAAAARQRQSQQSSVYSSHPSERGFQRVSGRKLAPVIQSGGDGYSEPDPMPQPGTAISSYGLEGQAPAGMATERSLYPNAGGAAGAAAAHRSYQTASDGDSMVANHSARNSQLLTAPERVAALRSQRMFSSDSPESFEEEADSVQRTPSPEAVVQQVPRRTPIVSSSAPRRPGDGIGRSRPSQDGSRVSRFSETF